MKKIVILLPVVLIVLAAAFIPYNQEKTIVVNASFFNVYQQLVKAENWKRWRNDLRQIPPEDSSKISTVQNAVGFKITTPAITLNVRPANGYSFYVDEKNNGKTLDYAYTVLPEKLPNETTIVLSHKSTFLNSILNGGRRSWSATHVDDFKNFMENASLYYGYEIARARVTDTDIVVLRQLVPAKDKFKQALKNLNILRKYIAANGLKQTQPLIAQFFPRGQDSVQLNIGLPVNKKTPAKNPVYYMEMPKTGYVYTAKYHGRFVDRRKVYAAMQQYFSDRRMQIPILPFETYAGDKLPATDTDHINIRIN
jgi:effector-binding domain-containing protein